MSAPRSLLRSQRRFGRQCNNRAAAISAATKPGRYTVTAWSRGSAGGGYASRCSSTGARAAAGGTSLAHAARGLPTWAARRSASAPPSAKGLVAFTVEDAQSDRSGRQCDIRSGDDCARRIQKPDLTLARRLGLLALVVAGTSSSRRAKAGMEATRSSLSGHSLQLRALCRKHWLSARKEALVSMTDRAASARDPTAPSALADPGLVPVRGPDRPDL